MKINKPLISVVMPAYNHGQFIGEALDSVLNQTHENVEVIVIDDGSTDNTVEVLKRYDKQIRYIYQGNRGVSSARNVGISMAEGEFVAFLDADDVWLPEKLELQLIPMEMEDSIGLVRCGCYLIDYSGKITKEVIRYNYRNYGDFLNDLLMANIMGNPSGVLIKKECFEKVGLFDERLCFGEDWDMWLRISKSYKIKLVEKAIYKVRQYEAAKGYKKSPIIESNIRIVLKKNEDLYSWAIKRKAYTRLYAEIALCCLNENNKIKAILFLLRSVGLHPFKLYPADARIKLLLFCIIPNGVYRTIKSVYNKYYSKSHAV